MPPVPGAAALLIEDANPGSFEIQTPQGAVRVRRENALSTEVRREDAVLRLHGAARDVDVVFFALDDRVEELIRVGSRGATVGYRFELTPGQRLVQRHPAVPAVEVVDLSGMPLLRMTAPKLWDRDGQEFPIALAIEGDRVTLRAPADAAFPVVMDPSWASARLMSSARFRHTATLLPSGRVLLVGGSSQTDFSKLGLAALDAAELYEPETGSFTPLPPLNVARWGHSATLLQDGKVLIAGGFGSDGYATATTELFDPETLMFAVAGTLNHPRALHTATLLGDGRVLVLGGVASASSTPVVVPSAELSTPSGDEFQLPGSPQFASFPQAAARLADGSVAVAWASPQGIQLERFDPAQNAFLDMEMTVPLDGATGNPDLVAFVPPVGGADLVVRSWSRSCEIYGGPRTVACGYYASGDYSNSTRGAAFSVSQLGAATLTLGGNDAVLSYQATALARWEVESALLEQRQWATSTSLPGSSVLVSGGLDAVPSATTELYAESEPIDVPTLLPILSKDQAAAVLSDGRVLISGGKSGSLATYAWNGLEPPVELGSLLDKRRRHRAILLESGKVLVAGGETDQADSEEELFDPSAVVSEPTGFRLAARASAVPAAGGRVVFAGASGLEVVDTRKLEILLRKAVELGCTVPGLVRLASGAVAVVGQREVFTFDSGTGEVSEPVQLLTARCDPAVAALPDGTVLIAGGAGVGAVGEPEVFDPARNTLRLLPAAISEVVGAQAFVDFWRVHLLGGEEPAGDTTKYTFNWGSQDWNADFLVYGWGSERPSVTRLVDGGFLVAGVSGARQAQAFRTGGMPGSSFAIGKPPIRVHSGDEVEVQDQLFSTFWSEGSSGTASASPTNVPVPVWTPAIGGWPVSGTFTSLSEATARWRVPVTSFPGMGFLSVAIHGVQHPLMAVEIAAADNGQPCESGGGCDSGFCVDGVCCNNVCDAPCKSCSAAAKGGGEDGSCGPTELGFADSACEIQTCKQNGVCDGEGACALYLDGDECGEGSYCSDRVCIFGAGECIDDDTSVDGECAPFRCALLDGVCLESCNTNRDCSEGNACDVDGQCAPIVALPSKELGCIPGCRVAGGNERTFALAWMGLLTAAALRRRRLSAF